MTSDYLQYVISLIAKVHYHYTIKYLGKLAQWQRFDKNPPSICYQISQQLLDGEGVTKYLSFNILSVLARTLTKWQKQAIKISQNIDSIVEAWQKTVQASKWEIGKELFDP